MIRIGIVDDEEIMRLKIHQCIKEILKEQESVEIRSYDCAEDFLEEVQKKTRFDFRYSDAGNEWIRVGKKITKRCAESLYHLYYCVYGICGGKL